MLKLTLQAFDAKEDERGYASETNRRTLLEGCSSDDNAQVLIDILTRFLQPSTTPRLFPMNAEDLQRLK